jgi:transposase-like protein
MENRVAEQDLIDQATFADEEEDSYQFETLGNFLDYIELGVRAFVRVMVQQYAEDEFLRYIGAKPYERTEKRKDYRNGTRRRTLRTRFGLIDDLNIPLARRGGLGYSTILERYRRQDSKIEDIVSEMFLGGVSTRKVGKVSRLLWDSEVSACEVSRMNKRVKKELIRWLNRPISKEIAYLIIDGAYFKVRRKRVGTEAVLCAVGITEDGHKEHLGFIQGHRESQEAWEFLLMYLVRRGLDPRRILMVVSDGCSGILAAIRTIFPESEHQRCLFHKMGNLQAKCPKTEWPLIKARLRKIYYAPNSMEARAQAEIFMEEFRPIYPTLVSCLEKDLDACIAYMNHPPTRWKHIRTTNIIERSFKEVKRRVKVMEQFPTEESCIRILFTLLQAQNDIWQGKPIKGF